MMGSTFTFRVVICQGEERKKTKVKKERRKNRKRVEEGWGGGSLKKNNTQIKRLGSQGSCKGHKVSRKTRREDEVM